MATPKVLMIGGLDPTGGAGLVADIETAAAFGCRTFALATALTVQDTHGVRRFEPVDPGLLADQADTLLADLAPDAVKIGMLASADIAAVVVGLLARCAGIPVVLDPVLASGAGAALATHGVSSVIRGQLADKCSLMTPNHQEMMTLYGAGNAAPPCAVLVTGTDRDPVGPISHELIQPDGAVRRWRWQRLPGSYHGSGCTLASAVASRLARGAGLVAAVQDAMAYTWESLAGATERGGGQWLPRRGPAEMFLKRGQRGLIC